MDLLVFLPIIVVYCITETIAVLEVSVWTKGNIRENEYKCVTEPFESAENIVHIAFKPKDGILECSCYIFPVSLGIADFEDTVIYASYHVDSDAFLPSQWADTRYEFPYFTMDGVQMSFVFKNTSANRVYNIYDIELRIVNGSNLKLTCSSDTANFVPPQKPDVSTTTLVPDPTGSANDCICFCRLMYCFLLVVVGIVVGATIVIVIVIVVVKRKRKRKTTLEHQVASLQELERRQIEQQQQPMCRSCDQDENDNSANQARAMADSTEGNYYEKITIQRNGSCDP